MTRTPIFAGPYIELQDVLTVGIRYEVFLREKLLPALPLKVLICPKKAPKFHFRLIWDCMYVFTATIKYTFFCV